MANRPTPTEMASWSEAQLRAYMKKLQDEGHDFSKYGFYAEATGDLDTGAVRGGMNHHSKSPFAGNKLKKGERTVSLDPSWKAPPIQKRSDVQRTDSMAKRLQDAINTNSWEAELILKDVQLELWRKGNAIAFEDLKVEAARLLKKAADNRK